MVGEGMEESIEVGVSGAGDGLGLGIEQSEH